MNRWPDMTAIVLGMVLVPVVALAVISVFSEEEDDWTVDRPGRPIQTMGTSTICCTSMARHRCLIG